MAALSYGGHESKKHAKCGMGKQELQLCHGPLAPCRILQCTVLTKQRKTTNVVIDCKCEDISNQCYVKRSVIRGVARGGQPPPHTLKSGGHILCLVPHFLTPHKSDRLCPCQKCSLLRMRGLYLTLNVSCS